MCLLDLSEVQFFFMLLQAISDFLPKKMLKLHQMKDEFPVVLSIVFDTKLSIRLNQIPQRITQSKWFDGMK